MLEVKKIKGYEKLRDNADMFKVFLNNFYNSLAKLEAGIALKPLSVKFCNNKNGQYLRFTYEIYFMFHGEIYCRKDWVHVTSPCEWY